MNKKLGAVTMAAVLTAMAISGAGEATAAGERPTEPLGWTRCSDDKPATFECATIAVPLDYADPQGRTIDIAISRVKATDQQHRHGALLMNPGGPGAPGLDMPVSAGAKLPKEVREHYDLIGFDPRGIGQSTPIDCGLPPGGWNPIPFDEATFDQNVADTKEMANQCWSTQADLLPFITTRNTARDMDAIRGALGESKISYWGTSYGTYLGTVFTQLFPERSDRIVLDSSIDPERVWRGMVQIWAVSAQRGFDAFAEWAAQRDETYRLGSTAQQVDFTFRTLLGRLDRTPVIVDGENYDGNALRQRGSHLGISDSRNRAYAELVRKVRDAADGMRRPSARDDRVSGQPAPPSHWASQASAGNMSSAFLGVVCGDAQWPRDVERYRRDARRDQRRYPIMGGATSNISPCAFWPEPREPATEVGDNQAPSILMVQNSHDFQTPIEGAKNLRRLLGDNTRMALVDGSWEHGAYPGNCADSVVTDYLVRGTVPKSDVTCANNPSEQ